MKVIVDFHDKPRAEAGQAKVIGKIPKHTPYVSISDNAGLPVASINWAHMTRLVKRWEKANKHRSEP